jgi:hypothetical protein
MVRTTRRSGLPDVKDSSEEAIDDKKNRSLEESGDYGTITTTMATKEYEDLKKRLQELENQLSKGLPVQNNETRDASQSSSHGEHSNLESMVEVESSTQPTSRPESESSLHEVDSLTPEVVPRRLKRKKHQDDVTDNNKEDATSTKG